MLLFYLNKMKKIKLTKISDDCFEGNHPNGINKRYTKVGYMIKKPTKNFYFYLYLDKKTPIFHTSLVTKGLNKDNIFKTMYSTYKIDYL